jgi:hypothetical protein
MPRKKPAADGTPAEPSRPVGRPSKYSPELADRICEYLMNGRDLLDICNDEDMPGRATVYRWLREHPDFDTQYARAREALADYEMHKLKEMAENCTEANVNSTRVKLNHFQWRVMKIAPRLYGERVQAEVTGANGGPIEMRAVTVDVTALDADAREAFKQALFAARRTIEHKKDGD